MIKVIQINALCGAGSTGNICVEISKALSEQGCSNLILYSVGTTAYPLGVRCSSLSEVRLQALRSKLFGNYGFNSRRATDRIISQLEQMKPDVVHLHNIHGHDCHLGQLFTYLKENRIKVLWTFHDCWAFTAYCPHFTMMKCGKWRTQCSQCIQRREYSWFLDRSKALFEKKKALLQGLDMTIITPSQWLADLVKQSFLKSYPVAVIHNGIDLDVFQPTRSDFRQKYGLADKTLVLGVSFGWDARKGLDVFLALAKSLPESYQIVLVGTDEKTDKQLPDNILSIHRTQNQRELAEIYTAADVFVNPTREDNYPTVNMEAIACGTPVVTFQTGGSPEMIDDTCGSVVLCDDMDALEKEIIRVCTDKPFSEEQCRKKAREFDKNERFKEYIALYERINAAGTEGNRV